MAQQLPLMGSMAVEAAALDTKTYDKAPRRYPTLRELPEKRAPRQPAALLWANALSTTELLAILAGTPHQLQDAANLMAIFEGIEGVARRQHARAPTATGHRRRHCCPHQGRLRAGPPPDGRAHHWTAARSAARPMPPTC